MNQSKMTKLIAAIAIAIFTHTTIFAELAFNKDTRKFYSKNPSEVVNQEEYHSLAADVMQIFAQKGATLSEGDLAMIFFGLRKIGTPASLQLIKDLEKLFKDLKEELLRVHNLCK